MLRIAEFEPIATAAGALYRPRVYADQNAVLWDGYIVFFPLGIGTVISTPRETTIRTAARKAASSETTLGRVLAGM